MQPLPDRIRPASLTGFIGQKHLVGPTGFISRLLNNPQGFPSLVFWGPPGSGKTTLARLIARDLNRPFSEFSPVTSTISDIKKAIPTSGSQRQLFNALDKAPLIFIDEIHRLNKAQQDALLPHVEKGTITLIGATTENPSFEVIGPLLSRCRVVVFHQLEKDELKAIISVGKKALKLKLNPQAEEFLLNSSSGDARVALNVLEIASNLSLGTKEITLKSIETALQKRQLLFDLKGEEYYNTISAFHKSIRGSDPDAALYYLARMLEAGQDPLYIARRLIRAASEDIGLADSQALILATSAFLACERIGMPECNVILAQVVVYLAKAPKSNTIYISYSQAAQDVHDFGNLPTPLHIRNPVTKLMKEIGYGKDYDYHHSATGQKNSSITYLPEKLKDRKYVK